MYDFRPNRKGYWIKYKQRFIGWTLVGKLAFFGLLALLFIKLFNMNYFDNLKIDYESESLTNQLQDLRLHETIKHKYKSIKNGWIKLNMGFFIALFATIVIFAAVQLNKSDMLYSKTTLIDLSEQLQRKYENLRCLRSHVNSRDFNPRDLQSIVSL